MKSWMQRTALLLALVFSLLLLAACGEAAEPAAGEGGSLTDYLSAENLPEEKLEGYLQTLNTTVSGGNVACTLLQVLEDNHALYLLLELSFRDGTSGVDWNALDPTVTIYDGNLQGEDPPEVKADLVGDGVVGEVQPGGQSCLYLIRWYSADPLFQENQATLVLSDPAFPESVILTWDRKADLPTEERTFTAEEGSVRSVTVTPFFLGFQLSDDTLDTDQKEEAVVAAVSGLKLLSGTGEEIAFSGNAETGGDFVLLDQGILLGTLVDPEGVDHIEISGVSYSAAE